MTHLIERARYVANGEEGASVLEIIVWFMFVLGVAVVIMVIKNSSENFLKGTDDVIKDLTPPRLNP